MKKYAIKSLKGFTLAEVLITLMVIGVIAALTIPNLITNIQDQHYKTAWKNVYSDFEQANKKALIDNGGSLKSVCPNTEYPVGNNCLREKFLEYMNYVKKCDNSQTIGNCFHEDNSSKELNGTPRTYADCAGGILTNGAIFDICLNSSGCTANYSGQMDPYCGNIAIDVNGFKGPNMLGKDIYAIWVLESSIKPAGYVNDKVPSHTTCTSGSTGTGCSAMYLYQ